MNFWYGTKIGRLCVQIALKAGLDKWVVKFLCSPFSRFLIPIYIFKHQISLEGCEKQKFRSFQEFFAREKVYVEIDLTPNHLISPCDGWMSCYPISKNSTFFIKGFQYSISDLIKDQEVRGQFSGGTCLVFRLCASDYHRYCFIDDGTCGDSHYIPGELHSVQPVACEKYPVYKLNRRVWTLLETAHFGPVVQTEVGAFVVGGIINEIEHSRVFRGMEKGHFDLAGSTIVLMFQKDRIRLLKEIAEATGNGREVRVRQGMCVGEKL